MTHCCHVSRRLLIKQNTHGLFCEFRTVHCQWICLCVCKSATYSSKLPLWHLYLLVRQLVGTWAKQRLGPFIMAHLHTASPQRQALGKWPHQQIAPPDPTEGLPSAHSFPQVEWVAGFLYHSFFCSIIFGSVLRHSDANNKESNLSVAQLRILILLSIGLNV